MVSLVPHRVVTGAGRRAIDGWKDRRISVICAAQNTAKQFPPGPALQTNGRFNGRAWNSLDEARKQVFLIGMKDGMFEVEPNIETSSTYFPKTLELNEFTKALDQLYNDPANILIPIVHAMALITLKVNGAQPVTIDKILAQLRATAISALENKK
jgi:hypothetical protein